MRAPTGSMASGAAEGVWIRPRIKRTSATAGGRQRNPTSFRLGRCRSALVREGVTGRATSRTSALLQQPWCCWFKISLAHSTSASAHRCLTSGAVSRAPGATARASRASGIWPSVGKCRSALVREGVTGRATSRTSALLQQPWCCRLEISLAHSTSAGVGAHLCARALPVEPHRARVRSYNNRGAVGSRSAWLTALLPAPTDAGPAARYPGRRARLPGPAGPAASGLRYPDSARRVAAAARWRPAPPTRPVRRPPG